MSNTIKALLIDTTPVPQHHYDNPAIPPVLRDFPRLHAAVELFIAQGLLSRPDVYNIKQLRQVLQLSEKSAWLINHREEAWAWQKLFEDARIQLGQYVQCQRWHERHSTRRAAHAATHQQGIWAAALAE